MEVPANAIIQEDKIRKQEITLPVSADDMIACLGSLREPTNFKEWKTGKAVGCRIITEKNKQDSYFLLKNSKLLENMEEKTPLRTVTKI